MKPKGEITYKPDTTIKEIKRAVHIISAIAIIVSIIGIVLGANLMILSAEYETLNQEKQALENLTKMQNNELTKQIEENKNLGNQIEELRIEVWNGR